LNVPKVSERYFSIK